MATHEERMYWRERGRRDAKKDKPPLFRKIGALHVANGEPPADWTAADEDLFGRAYLVAYDAFFDSLY